eukprot:CAMPEP_0172163200 /NCGR_PEP_ID=MMETSP1050-20130122/7136_1 /TAXON_ID=233186 /ORGANISM="Cryptomonas curvata, Strain CCAP979/52" /LENGTH=55 /DNA_ID=CAMNT_0012833357 /DNA_START=36 /DNA_END=203 /DNA_ORIENTATION=+
MNPLGLFSSRSVCKVMLGKSSCGIRVMTSGYVKDMGGAFRDREAAAEFMVMDQLA